MRRLKIAAGIVLAVLVLVVFFQNTETVQVRLLFAKAEMPLAALLALTLAVGFALGMLFDVVRRKKKA